MGIYRKYDWIINNNVLTEKWQLLALTGNVNHYLEIPGLNELTDGYGSNIAHYAALSGQPKALQWVEQNTPNLLMSRDRLHLSIAEYAALSGRPNALHWVAQNTPDLLLPLDDRTSYTLAHYAGLSGVVEQFNEAQLICQNPQHFDLSSPDSPNVIHTLIAALPTNESIIRLGIPSDLGETILQKLVDALQDNWTVLEIYSETPEYGGSYWFLTRFEQIIARNNDLHTRYIKPLTTTDPPIFTHLQQIKTDFPDIDSDQFEGSNHLASLFKDYVEECKTIELAQTPYLQINLIEACCSASTPIKPFVTLLVDSLFGQEQSLDEAQNQARHRLILWLLRDSLNDERYQNHINTCIRKLSSENDNPIQYQKNRFIEFETLITIAKQLANTQELSADERVSLKWKLVLCFLLLKA